MRRLILPFIALTAFAFAVLGAPSIAMAKRVALVVGIDHYDNLTDAQQLKKAVSDSRAMSEVLSSLGYNVQQADNVTRLEFLRQWQRFLNGIEPGDEAALYFAGHGVEIGGLNFLLPSDVPRVASGEEEVLKASSLSLSNFLEQVRERKPQTMLYVIDACRDNPFINSGGRGIGGTRGLTLVEPPSGTFVMFSAGAGETALDRLSDSDRNANSVYTRVLVPRLKAPGKIGDIARDVRREVRELASRVNHVQTPAFYDEVIGDFCPSGCAVEAKVEPPPPPPPDPAMEAWNATRGTTSIEVLSAYVSKYKSSFYAELAKARIDELKRQQQLGAVAPPKPQVVGPDPSIEAWKTVKDTQSISVLETFIGKYPMTFYAELARVHLKELKQKQQAALVAPPPPKVSTSALVVDASLGAWEAAKGSQDVGALETFVDKYPLSLHAKVAKGRIEELKRKEEEAARQDMVRDIQTALKNRACYDGAIDGVWSNGSRDALARFNRLAKLNPDADEPDQATLDALKAWTGERCPVEKLATPSKEKAPSVRKRPAAKTANTPKTPKSSKVAKTPRAKPKEQSARKAAPSKKASAKAPASKSGEVSVYCHQGCAGGFEDVLKTTRTIKYGEGAKR